LAAQGEVFSAHSRAALVGQGASQRSCVSEAPGDATRQLRGWARVTLKLPSASQPLALVFWYCKT